MINRSNDYKYLECLLDLEHRVCAARYIESEEEYKNLAVKEFKGTMCVLARQGLDGNHIKADSQHITCDYGAYASGIKKPSQSIKAGQSYANCGLYSGKAVARSIVESMHYLEQDVYGIEFAPLEKIENPDLVLIVCNPKQAMMIFQGYAYTFGEPKNLSFFGNQATCADLLSKPFYNNDINMSLMCEGTRKYGRYRDDELGISMPADLFHYVAQGVYKVLPSVANLREKRELVKRLQEKNLIYNIEQKAYGDMLKKYDSENNK